MEDAMDGITVSKSIDEIRDTDVPSPWPAECAECDVILRNRREAEAHRAATEHEDVVVPATERDRELGAIRDAVSEWKSADCFDCGEHFTSREEADGHREIFGHNVIDYVGSRAVN
jgi:hypothetical protein